MAAIVCTIDRLQVFKVLQTKEWKLRETKAIHLQASFVVKCGNSGNNG